ncbi:MAG: extracellular solute-binding protein [Acetatifactor sp.]|nr:extracellular solute-binding protein [Acetatifactor sp.]
MKMKKALALCLSAAMTMTLFAGCGSTEETKTADTAATTETTETATTDTAAADTTAEVTDVALKVWAPEEDMVITQQMCDSFQAAHPEYNITWDLSVTGVDESAAQLTTDADAAADVFLVPSGSIPELVEAGLLYPITYDLDNVAALYSENALAACTKDGLVYGLPSTPNCWFMYYNKSLYTEDDVKSLETMMAKDLGDGIYNYSCTLTNSWYLEAFFYAAGCTLFGPEGDNPDDCSWNDENGLATVDYLIDLVKNPKYVEDIDGIAGSLFMDGKLGAVSTGNWSGPGFVEALGDDLGAVALPTVTIGGKTAHLSNFADYKCYAVKSNTAFPVAAQQFAEWINNEENQLIRYKECGTTPTVVALQDNAEVASDISTLALLDQTNYATAQPAISQISQYWTPVATLGTAIYNGEVTSDNAQEYLDKTVDDITSKLVAE